MLTSRGILALALPAALASAGCAGSARPLTSLDGVAPGTTTLRVSNHVDAPGELERLSIAVDGEPLPLSALPPRGGEPATVGSVRLPPGAHSIAVRATARHGGEVIVVGAQQPFLVEHGPAAIGVDVRTATSPLTSAAWGDNPKPPGDSTAAERASNAGVSVAVNLSMLGGRMAAAIGAPPPDGKDERCAALQPIPRALCRAAFDLDEANRRNDVVSSLCLRDKLAELRKLAVIGESGRADSLALAEAQAAILSQRADRCVGEVVASPAPDGVTVTRSASP